MKKKVLLIMGLSLLLLAGGCSKNGAAGDLKPDTDTDKSSTSNLPERPDYNASKYVTLGKYKGVEVTITERKVTDKQVQDAIDQKLASTPSYEEIKDKKVVENGDIANIDFEGLKDGVAFDGGSAKGTHLSIGSGQFIPGFESGLVGHKVGEKVKLDITFPKDYQSTELAGKAVVFNVTINKIEKEVTATLTEEYVKANTDYKTVDEFKEGTRKELEASNDQSKQSEMEANLIDTIMKDTKFSEVPKDLQAYYEKYLNYQVDQAAAQMQVDKAAYLQQVGMSQEDFDKYVKTYSETQAKQEMTLKAIAEAEKFEVTDKEFKDKVADLMKNYGYKTEDELFKVVPKEELKSNMLIEKAYNLIMDQCKLKTVAPSPSPEPTKAAEK